MEVHALEVLDQQPTRLSLRVTCGSGTYIRSLARDLGETLGCGAHIAGLRRLWVDPFREAPMVTLDTLRALAEQGDEAAMEALLLPLVIPEVMIQSGGSYEALIESDLRTGGGIGLLEGCIIDTHFIKRGRFGRLAHAIIRNPGHIGIGLGEDTAIIVKRGYEAKCLGSGMVVLIDGRDIEQTNINHVNDDDDPIYVDHLRVHLLVKGCRFDIRNCKVKHPKLRGSSQFMARVK